MKKSLGLHDIVAVGLMAALTFVASNISFDIPTAVGNTRLHIGNVVCILSGLLFGAVRGGLAAGLGSFMFDLFNPRYIDSAPFTLVFKFAMAFVCGLLAYSGGAGGRSVKKNIAAAVSGSVTYIILYLSRAFLSDILFLKAQVETALIDVAQKGGVSLVNGALAVAASVPLGVALKKSLDKLDLYRKIVG